MLCLFLLPLYACISNFIQFPCSYIFVGMPQLDSKIRGCHLLLGRHQSQIERLGVLRHLVGLVIWPRMPASQKKNAVLCGQHGYGWMEWRNWVDTWSEWIRSIYLTAKKNIQVPCRIIQVICKVKLRFHMVPSPTTRWHCVWHGPWHTIVGSWGCRPTAFRFMSLAVSSAISACESWHGWAHGESNKMGPIIPSRDQTRHPPHGMNRSKY